MYIEELEIDIFMHKLREYENLDEEQRWQAEEPRMSATVQKYYDSGELFLEDQEYYENEKEIAPDVMSTTISDIFD